jgi:hypothetical protein
VVTEPTNPRALAYTAADRADEIRVEPVVGGAYLVVPGRPGHPAAVPFGLALAVALAATVAGNRLVAAGGGPWDAAAGVLVGLLLLVLIAGCVLLAHQPGWPMSTGRGRGDCS